MSRSKFCTRSNTSTSGSGVVQHFLNSLSPSTKMSKNAKNTLSVKAVENTPKRRINRCKKCDNCLKDNCGFCRNCKDMRKFGGQGTLKQSCLTRPKCLNVVIPTMEKHDKRNPVLKRSLRSAGRPRKFAKFKDKNENIIERTNKAEKDSFHEDIILPYEPRVFPMSDADYRNMMSEKTGSDDTESFSDNKKLKKYKDIPTRSWRIPELRRRKRLEDSVAVNDTEEILNDSVALNETEVIMYPLRDCMRKIEEVDDFEDTRDEVYMMRHARAAANDKVKKIWNDEGGGGEGEPENGQGHNRSFLVEESTSVVSHNFENTREVARRLRHSRVPPQEETTRVKPLDDVGGGLQTEPDISEASEASGSCMDMKEKEYRLRRPRTALNNKGSQIGLPGGKGEKMKEKPENETNKGGVMVTRAQLMANTLSKAGLSIASSLKDTNSSRRTFLIPLMSHHLEVKFPELSNFGDDPNLQAILHSSKIPKCMKEIQTGRKKLGSARGLRIRRTSGAQSKA